MLGVIASKTALLMKIKLGAIKPGFIISLKKIGGLDQISFDRTTGLTIGATALLADVADHPDILKHYPAVAQAARGTANVQVRNMGTVIRNLVMPHQPRIMPRPCLPWRPGSYSGSRGKKKTSLDQFFKGPGMTALKPSEIVTAVGVPVLPPMPEPLT